MICRNCGKEMPEGLSICPDCGFKHEEGFALPEPESREFHFVGIRGSADGLRIIEVCNTDVKVDGAGEIEVSYRDKIFSSEKQFYKQDVKSLDLPLLPIWGILDVACLIFCAILVPLSFGLALPFLLVHITFMLSRQIRIRLNSGKIIKIPIGQKAEASEFLKEFNYPMAEIQKNNAEEMDRRRWFRRKKWTNIILTDITLLLAVLGIYMFWGFIQDYGDNQYIHSLKNEELEREQAVYEEISDSKEDKDYENVQTPNVQENDEDEYVDLEGMIGQPEEKLKELGFTYDEDEMLYQLLDGAIGASCLDEKVNMIGITGSVDDTWKIHGISIGMDLEEADALLADKYSSYSGEEMEESYTYYIDKNSGNLIAMSDDNGVITEIALAHYIEESQKDPTQENQSQEYIFPDSNSRYLSEEEIRSMDADKLRIARNEILARHGYIFNDEELNQYFNSTSWYHGTVRSDEFRMDWVLNDFEKKNIELISYVEESNRESSTAKGETISDADVVGGYANITEMAESLIESNANIIGQKVAFCGWGFYHDVEKIQLRYFEGENDHPLVTAYYDAEKVPTMSSVEPFNMANTIVWGTVRGISDDYGIEIDLDAMNISDQNLWFTQYYAEDYREVSDAYEARAAEWGGKLTLEGTVQAENNGGHYLILDNGDQCGLWGGSSEELSSIGDIAVYESFNGLRVKIYGKLADASPAILVDYIVPIDQ